MTAPHDHRVEDSRTVFEGRIISVRTDVVTMPGDTTSQRDYVVHPGAVGAVVLTTRAACCSSTSTATRCAGASTSCPPACSTSRGEPALQAAQRELAEEAGLAADTWHVLVDTLTSPGMSDEAIRIFLARDVRVVDRDVQRARGGRHDHRTGCRWSRPSARALAGEIENAMAVVGHPGRRPRGPRRLRRAATRRRPLAEPEDRLTRAVPCRRSDPQARRAQLETGQRLRGPRLPAPPPADRVGAQRGQLVQRPVQRRAQRPQLDVVAQPAGRAVLAGEGEPSRQPRAARPGRSAAPATTRASTSDSSPTASCCAAPASDRACPALAAGVAAGR